MGKRTVPKYCEVRTNRNSFCGQKRGKPLASIQMVNVPVFSVLRAKRPLKSVNDEATGESRLLKGTRNTFAFGRAMSLVFSVVAAAVMLVIEAATKPRTNRMRFGPWASVGRGRVTSQPQMEASARMTISFSFRKFIEAPRSLMSREQENVSRFLKVHTKAQRKDTKEDANRRDFLVPLCVPFVPLCETISSRGRPWRFRVGPGRGGRVL